jgi:hypothetical protein
MKHDKYNVMPYKIHIQKKNKHHPNHNQPNPTQTNNNSPTTKPKTTLNINHHQTTIDKNKQQHLQETKMFTHLFCED